MDRESQVLDASGAHLLDEVLDRSVLFAIEVLLDIELAYVVHEVEIEAIYAAALQLLRENLLVLPEVRDVVSGELGGEVIRITGIFR